MASAGGSDVGRQEAVMLAADRARCAAFRSDPSRRPNPATYDMLDDLKKMFSQAWDSFMSEVKLREPEDQVAGLLGAMRREMVAVRAEVPALEEQHRGAVAELERERRRLDDVVRRGGMAKRIGDAETVRVAKEFEEKHHRRIAVLEEKVRVTKAEWELRQHESQEMMAKYKEAEANRFALLAELRRQGARGTINAAMGGPGGEGDDFGRAAGKIEDEAAYADALRDLDGEEIPRRPQPADVDARLEELKRRMGM
jgi:phage shock protein A